MLISFLKTGSYDGVGSEAVEYLIAELDHKNRVRPEVTILRGDPERTAKVIDCLNFSKHYTSMVLAFEKLDNPTHEQIISILDDVEKMAFAGMKDCELFAVMHKEIKGGIHVHVLIPNVCYSNGKSFNPVPPRHEYRYGDLCKAYNYRYNWASPDDPKRARPYSLGKMKSEANTKLHKEINQQVSELILTGKVKSFEEMIAELSKKLNVKIKKDRKDPSKTYLLIKEPNAEKGVKGIRFEGAIFDRKMYDDIDFLKNLLQPRIKEVTLDLEKSEKFLQGVNDYIVRTAKRNHKTYYPDETEKDLYFETINFNQHENHWDFCEQKEEQDGMMPENYIAKKMPIERVLSQKNPPKKEDEKKKSVFIGSSYRSSKEFKRRMFHRLYEAEIPKSFDSCYIYSHKKFIEIYNLAFTLIDYDDRVNVSYENEKDLEEAVNAAIDLCLAKGWKLESIYSTGDDEIFNEAVREELERRLGKVEVELEL